MKYLYLTILILTLSGCETGKRNAKVSAALGGAVKRYETRIENARAREEADEDAIVEEHRKKVQIAANQSVQIIANDPVTYPPNKAILEVHRVNQVANEKIASQQKTIQKMKDLRSKDDAVNLTGARVLMSKVIEFDQAPAIDLTGTVSTILAPASPKAVPEPGN